MATTATAKCGCRWFSVPDGHGGGDGEFVPCAEHAYRPVPWPDDGEPPF